MPSRLAAHIARPYICRELPGWGKLYRAFVGGPDEICWKDAPTKVIRGKLHGQLMRLDLSNWSERSTYFLSRYYDLDSQLLYQLLIDEGDAILDVGANIGMMTLLAARLVGPSGRIDCVEPNPVCVKRLHDHAALNNLTNVHVHHCGFADENNELILRVVTEHTGMGSLADVPPEHEHLVSASIPVPVCRGDDLVATLSRPPRLIKIDVEGFELRAVKGLHSTISDNRPILMLEFVESHLNRAGTSRAELSDYLRSLGYEGFASSLRREGLRYRLALKPLDAAEATDTLWIHPEDSRKVRLRSAQSS